MKKILIACLLISALTVLDTGSAAAQFQPFTLNKTTTVSGADTITGTVRYPGSTAFSVTFTANVTNGTASKLYLYGSNQGNTYKVLDSVSVSYSGSTAKVDYDFNHFTNSKFDKPDFLWYKFVWLQTAGSISGATGAALIRTGGN
jgi:hypothetical protein